jgi:glycosyltransferase involved in cell wall biosynthesis
LSIKALEAINKHSDGLTFNQCGQAKLPLVSIIITNHNYASYLDECINSCLSQDYPFCEIILVDDKSSDLSVDVYKKYVNQINIVELKENCGQLGAMFSGLQYVNGEFIVFVDADDFLDNDAISAHIYLHLFQKPPVAFTCLRNRQVSEKSAAINDFHLDFLNNGQEVAYIEPRVIHTPTWSWSTTSAMCFRTDLVRLISTENTSSFRICADYYIVHFANLLGGSLLFDRAKVNYRRHGKNNFSKNFVIGGHRPTGHSEYHQHPSQSALQIEILGKLINEREKFEPYFPSLERYVETILYVAPYSFVKQNFKLDNKLEMLIAKISKQVEKQKNEQIFIKKWAIRLYKMQNKINKIIIFKNNLLKTYGATRNNKN